MLEEAYKQHTNHHAATECQITQQQEQIHVLQSEVRSCEEHIALQNILGKDSNNAGILGSPNKCHQL